jgi:hypothetical protein
MILLFCSGAGFCKGREGNIWDLVKKSDDAESKKITIQQACHCTSGRLVVTDKKINKEIEPDFEQSISVIYEPWKKVGGAIWAKGKIPIESGDGKKYEVRNRVALCRCGNSGNKPFCDGTHRKIGFKDTEVQ